jgi:aspartate aminotransferase
MLPEKVQESLTLALLGKVREMRARGEDVVSFAAGEPDFDTPAFVVEEAYRSLKVGNTRYVASQGQANLRQAIADDYKNRLGVAWAKPEHVLVTAGAKQGLFLLFDTLLEKGDEVLIPIPYWVSYPPMVKATGGVSKFVTTQAKNQYFPSIEELDAARSPKTKALIFSSPGNPSGTMIQAESLKKIIDWCEKNQVVLIYDELYERLVLDKDQKHVCALAVINEAKSEWVVSVNATSKSLAMTGWRLGYLLSHSENIKRLTAVQSQALTCVPGFIQDAAVFGLSRAGDFLAPKVEQYRVRRDVLIEGLKKIPSLKWIYPTGAFYLFLDVSEAIKKKGLSSDKDFAAKILEEKKVVVIPGGSMGFPNWVRLSFATNDDEIKKGIQRLAEFIGV